MSEYIRTARRVQVKIGAYFYSLIERHCHIIFSSDFLLKLLLTFSPYDSRKGVAMFKAFSFSVPLIEISSDIFDISENVPIMMCKEYPCICCKSIAIVFQCILTWVKGLYLCRFYFILVNPA